MYRWGYRVALRVISTVEIFPFVIVTSTSTVPKRFVPEPVKVPSLNFDLGADGTTVDSAAGDVVGAAEDRWLSVGVGVAIGCVDLTGSRDFVG